MSLLVRLCVASFGGISKLQRFLGAGLNGLWLGLLNHEQLNAVSEATYGRRRFYSTPEYNLRGLWDWESRMLERYFTGRKHLLVAAVGGGREVLALRQRGFVVDGFEAHPGLVRFANEFLEREGHGNGIRQAPWDDCPEYTREFDGVIVGWGAYMHIRGRERRVSFLRKVRQRVKTGSPILVSFMTVDGLPLMMRAATRIANAVARPLGRDRIEPGDWMEPAFTHYFTEEEVELELREGGFEMVHYSPHETGYAVGIAMDSQPQ